MKYSCIMCTKEYENKEFTYNATKPSASQQLAHSWLRQAAKPSGHII